MESGLTRNQIVSALTKSTHRDLDAYRDIGVRAVREDPEFFAHLIAWNHRKGQVRDSKVALPTIAALYTDRAETELLDNALAGLAALDPRNLVRAVRFAINAGGKNKRALGRLVEQYLRAREAKRGWWDRTALQHRQSMKELYALKHVKPSKYANDVLFKGEKPGVFGVVAGLERMTDKDAANAIITHRIPFLVASTSLGARMKNPDLLMALVEQMSPTEVVTNAKMLERFGVNNTPAVRGAFQAKLKEIAKSKQNVLKTSKAVEQLGEDTKLGKQLQSAQEKQLDAMAIDGDWLVLADKSLSMSAAIEAAKEIAAVLARAVSGNVYLVFFDTSPRMYDVTGKQLEEIKSMTQRIRPNGGTSIGTGLRYMLERGLNIDGIAIISDGGENTAPLFHTIYPQMCESLGKQPPVYLYEVPGDANMFSLNMNVAGLDFEHFNLRNTPIDYYSLPNLVLTMRSNRYALVDEIMATPLMRVSEVLR